MIDYTGATPKAYIYILDVHGNVIGLSDDTGILVNYEYDAWGNIINIPQSAPVTGNGEPLASANPFRYCGYQFDGETGFYYLKYRYYYPVIGRFLTKDPMMSYNRYMYCSNTPVNFVDPLGLANVMSDINSRPAPIYYHAGKAISDAKKSNDPNIIKALKEALDSPDLVPSTVATVTQFKADALRNTQFSQDIIPRKAYKLMFDALDEADEIAAGSKALSTVGKMIGVGGSIISGGYSIYEDINNPLYSNRDKKVAIAIDGAAMAFSIAAVIMLPATATVLGTVALGIATGALINYSSALAKEVFID